LLGSGYGSFSDIYITRESIESLRPVYTNHLHNDYLQLILEGGMLGVGAFILMVYTIIAATVAGFKNQKTRGLVLAGAVTVLLFGLHSIVDYPLRRPAAVAYFGIGLACLLRSFLHITGSGNQVKRSQSA
jgi:O-antigen ligase